MCNKQCNNCLAAIIIGAIAGVIIGLLFFFALIPGIITAIIVGLIFAAISLILITVIAAFAEKNAEKCVCKDGKCIVIGSIGTIVLGIVALAITLTTGSVGVAILIGLLGAFLVGTIISLLFLGLCLAKSNCKGRLDEEEKWCK